LGPSSRSFAEASHPPVETASRAQVTPDLRASDNWFALVVELVTGLNYILWVPLVRTCPSSRLGH
jgi:hypothetical protein